jgi:AcrR family transcriptional regulator
LARRKINTPERAQTDENAPAQEQEQSRMDVAAWTQAGLSLLAASGVDAVRVEPLARRLKVTKGSFYYHFKDRAGLLSAMLAAWRRQATTNIIDRIARAGQSPDEQLSQLVNLPLLGKRSSEGAGVELAVRLWAKSDPAAAAALEEIDTHRLAHLRGILQELGIRDEAERKGRAFLYYAYMLAEAFVTSPMDAETKAEAERFLAMPSTRRPEPSKD